MAPASDLASSSSSYLTDTSLASSSASTPSFLVANSTPVCTPSMGFFRVAEFLLTRSPNGMLENSTSGYAPVAPRMLQVAQIGFGSSEGVAANAGIGLNRAPIAKVATASLDAFILNLSSGMELFHPRAPDRNRTYRVPENTLHQQDALAPWM